MSRRILVNRSIQREVFLHNLLEGLLSQINQRFDALTLPERKPGWKAEALNGVIILAMLNEGWVNAIGQKTILDWEPKDNTEDRLKKVRKTFLNDLHFNKRPLLSVEDVREIRNSFAHAKPLIEERFDEEVTVDEGDQDAFFRDLRHPIEDKITIESYRRFREDSERFRQLLLERSRLQHWDIRTKAEEQSVFLRNAEE